MELKQKQSVRVVPLDTIARKKDCLNHQVSVMPATIAQMALHLLCK